MNLNASDEVILTYLRSKSILEVLDLAHSSQRLRRLARVEISTRHIRMLNGFFDDPARILRLMKKKQVVISGSFALAYFLGSHTWKIHDCDFYAPFATYGDVVSTFIRQEGYEVESQSDLSVQTNQVHGDSVSISSIVQYMR